MHAHKFVQFDNRPNEICLDTLSTHTYTCSLQILVFRSVFAVWEKGIEITLFKMFSAILLS